jgi:ribosome-associated translation inhibitor RaiA
MLAHIQFLRMSRSEGVENYVTSQLEDLLELIPSKKAHFRVWVECLNSQIQAGQDMFRCAIEVEGVRRHHYFAEKKDHNFYVSVNHAVEAIRKMFRRDKKMARSLMKTNRHGEALTAVPAKKPAEVA